MIKNSVRALVAGIGFLGVFSLPVQSFAQAFNPPANTFAYGPAWQAVGPTENQLGSYSMSLTSGTIGAGIAAASPVFSFRYGGTGVAVLKRVTVSAYSLTGFAAGVGNLQMFAARAFTASDTGGTAATITGNNGKLRTNFATTGVSNIQIANTGAMTAGTRTLDTQAMNALSFALTTGTNTSFIAAATSMFTQGNDAGYPYVMATNEGFVLQTTLPATGTWVLTVNLQWDEYAAY